MRTFDRQGVHIDRCDGCQGIFLDRGELERVVAAEQRHYGVAPPPPPDPQVRSHPHPHPQAPHQPAAYPRGGYPDSPGGYRDSPRGYSGYRDSPGPYRGRRKKSFLEGLFD